MGKSQTTNSTTEIPKEWRDAFTEVYGMGKGAANQPYEAYGTQPSDYVAQLTDQQRSGMQHANDAASSWQPTMEAATSATTAGGQAANLGNLDVSKYMSPYIKNVADTTAVQMGQQQQQAQAGQMGNAIRSGAFGGDRSGIAAAVLQGQQSMATGSTMANIYNQGYGQALGTAQQQQGAQLSADQANLARQSQMGQGLAAISGRTQAQDIAGANAQMQAGSLDQSTNQANINAMIQNFQQKKGYDFQTAQYLANLASAFGSGSGSKTSTTSPAGFFSGFADGGAVEGFDQGGIAGPYGANLANVPEGISGWVPNGLLKQRQILQGDPNAMQMHQKNAEDKAKKVSSFGESIKSLPDDYNSVSDWLKASGKASGGRATLADGGYMDQIPGANIPPGIKKPYTHDDNSSGKSGGSSGLSDIASIAKLAMGFMSSGGRAGFADGGNPGETTAEMIQRINNDASSKPTEQYDGGIAGKLGHYFGNLASGNSKTMSDILIAQDRAKGLGLNPSTQGTPGRPDFPPAYVVPPVDTPPSIANAYSPAASMGTPTSSGQLQIVRPPQPTLGNAVLPVPNAVSPLSHPISATARSAFAPETSLRPQPRPPQPAEPGLGMADLNAAGIYSGIPPVKDMGEIKENNIGTLADATVLPNGGVSGSHPPTSSDALIPVKTQVAYAMSEREFNNYNRHNYSSPEEAAVGSNTYFEVSGTQYDHSADNYARKIYDAAQKGDLSGLPPAIQEAYNQLTSSGVSPVNAAGLAGRWMFESSGDPNARNDIKGGNGTYGLGQWRGPRFSQLSEFSGVPIDAMTGLPSTSGQADGGGGISGAIGKTANAIGTEAGKANQTLGSIMHNPDGSFNKDALLSILFGLGTMASSPSRYFGTALLQGIGGGAQAYMGQEARRQDITAQQLGNSKTGYDNYMQAKALNPALANASYEDWVKTQTTAPAGSLPYSAGAPGGAGATPSNPSGWQADINELNTKVIDYGGGVKVNASQDRGYLQKWNTDHAQAAVNNTFISKQIEANQTILNGLPEGGAIDVNGNRIPQPGAINTADQAGLADSQIKGREEYINTINKTLPSLNAATQNLDKITQDYQKFDPGAMTSASSGYASIIKAMDPNDTTGIISMFDDPSSVEVARKRAAAYIASQFNNLPGAPAAGLSVLAQMSPDSDLQPEAVRQIIVQAKATVEQQKTMADDYLKAGSPRDVATFQRDWLSSNDLSKFYAEQDKIVPELGLRNQPDTAPEKIQSAKPGDTIYRGGKPYTMGPDGTWKGN